MGISTDKLVKQENENLTEDLRFILGRPNFKCAAIAERMRKKGFECDTKAEDEQALVIHTMLTFYNEFGKSWKEKMETYLKED